jgi:hypothetical protein
VPLVLDGWRSVLCPERARRWSACLGSLLQEADASALRLLVGCRSAEYPPGIDKLLAAASLILPGRACATAPALNYNLDTELWLRLRKDIELGRYSTFLGRAYLPEYIPGSLQVRFAVCDALNCQRAAA